jgi:FtsZ-binding cell division protein ZapB
MTFKEAPSLFSTPRCLIARGVPKVKDDDDGDDNDNDNEYAYDDLVKMTSEADDYMYKEKEKFKELKDLCILQMSFEELKISHDNLKEDHDDGDDNDDEYSYDDLVKMISEANDYMYKEKEKFKELKDFYILQMSFEEIKISHDKLKEDHDKLKEAQNSSLVHVAITGKVDMGVTCDLPDNTTNAPSHANIS